jgi:hypothetical protein
MPISGRARKLAARHWAVDYQQATDPSLDATSNAAARLNAAGCFKRR